MKPFVIPLIREKPRSRAKPYKFCHHVHHVSACLLKPGGWRDEDFAAAEEIGHAYGASARWFATLRSLRTEYDRRRAYAEEQLAREAFRLQKSAQDGCCVCHENEPDALGWAKTPCNYTLCGACRCQLTTVARNRGDKKVLCPLCRATILEDVE